MTTEERLAAIEKLPEGTYRDTKGIGWHGTVVSPSQLEWLIAEVRRLQAEYARGREDERREVLAWIHHINLGIHAEATNGKDV